MRSRGVEKSKCRESNARTKLTPAVWVRSLTPGASTTRLSKLTEQTGNVYENKEPGQEVEKSRSREIEQRKVEESRGRDSTSTTDFDLGPGTAVNCSTARLLDFSTFRRNKPGMSMKTKNRVKKSRLEYESKVDRRPGAYLLTPRLSTPRLLDCTTRLDPPSNSVLFRYPL